MEVVLDNFEAFESTIESPQILENVEDEISPLEAYENRTINELKNLVSNNYMESDIDQYCVASLNGFNRKSL